MSASTYPLKQDQIKSLLSHAVLAPSSHNTQPWRFQIADGTVSMFADRTRALPANDPDDRELTISCGCALMNLRAAAAHAGLGVNCSMLPDATEDDLLAVISFSEQAAVSPNESRLFKSIEARRTYRKRFASAQLSAALLDAVCAAAADEACWLEVIASDASRRKAAELVAEGDAIQWSNPDWRKELAAWMHPRRRGDGLTVPAILAPIVQVSVRSFDMGSRVGAKNQQLAAESPVLAALGTAGDTVLDWLSAGQALQNVLLTAHFHGLQASYLNQPIQVASLRPRLQNLLRQQGFPQILLRLGFPVEEIEAAPRRLLDEVIA